MLRCPVSNKGTNHMEKYLLEKRMRAIGLQPNYFDVGKISSHLEQMEQKVRKVKNISNIKEYPPVFLRNQRCE